MVGSTSLRFILTSSLALLASLSIVGTASAQLMEPIDSVNKSGFGPIPKDPRTQCTSTKVGGSVGCTGTKDTGDYEQYSGNVNNLDNMSLIGLFKWFEVDASNNLLVDFAKDAKTEPSTFNPLCSIQGKMVLRGGGCLVDFGWYCADGTQNPEIHPLVTTDDILAYAKAANPPYPKAWQNNDNSFLPKVGWEVEGKALSDVPNDADFKKCSTKKIGFAVKGNGTANCGTTGVACACTQNKYTERKLNQIASASGENYIAAVIYPSVVTPGRFYIAVEDLPTSTSQFDAPYVHKTTSGDVTWNADGDFNDFVYIVEGVVCQGGGQLCTVSGQQGICATGVTSCVTDTNATPTCDPVFTPQTEKCNAIDDDCNGTIDDGDNLCEQGYTCYKGSCVTECVTTGEFSGCASGQLCVGKLCVDAACAAANCSADQKCVNGTCIGGCDDVTCLAGEQCVAGKCVDLCDARTAAGMSACPANFVCQNGACVPNCTCLNCPSTDQECQTDSTQKTFGRCVATGCGDGHCGDQLCVPGGECVSPCDPNPCGTDQTCTAAKVYNPDQDKDHQYSCTNPNDPTNVGGSGAGGSGSNPCLGCNAAGSGNNASNSTNPANNGSGAKTGGNSTGSMGCGCRLVPSQTRLWGLAGIAGLALMALRRRRQ